MAATPPTAQKDNWTFCTFNFKFSPYLPPFTCVFMDALGDFARAARPEQYLQLKCGGSVCVCLSVVVGEGWGDRYLIIKMQLFVFFNICAAIKSDLRSLSCQQDIKLKMT